jgi:hypothetical protein
MSNTISIIADASDSAGVDINEPSSEPEFKVIGELETKVVSQHGDNSISAKNTG